MMDDESMRRPVRGVMNTRVPSAFKLPILDACYRDDAPRLRWLLSHGARPDAREFLEGKQGSHLACESNAPRALRVLLNAGVDPDARAKSGRRPLHACCINDASECAALLLAHGADPRCVDDRGLSVADYIDLYGADRVRRVVLQGAVSSRPPATIRRTQQCALDKKKNTSSARTPKSTLLSVSQNPAFSAHRNGVRIVPKVPQPSW